MYRQRLTALASRASSGLRRLWYRRGQMCVHRPRTEAEFVAVMERARPGDIVVVPHGNDWSPVAPALADGVTFRGEPGVVALAFPVPLRQEMWN